jgi:hypothetical protein
VSEVFKFAVAFVLGIAISIVGYKFLGVPRFLGGPGEWGEAHVISVRLEGPFTPVAQDPSYYGPTLCQATVKIENRRRHAVSLSYLVTRPGQAAASQDPYAPSPGNGGNGDNAQNGGSYDSQYGDSQNGGGQGGGQGGDGSGGYGQENSGQSDTPYADEVKPDETVQQSVRVQVSSDSAQDNYGQGAAPSCADLNRKGAVQFELMGCSVEDVSDPKDADCGKDVHADF